MFGITSRFDGVIEITPALPGFARQAALRGVRIRGRVFDVAMDPDGYTVTTDGKEYRARYGQTVRLTESGGETVKSRSEQEDGLPLY